MSEPYTGQLEDATRAAKKELIATIRAEIDRNGGALRFDRFMELALYSSLGGYYADAATIPTGRAGDFFTNVSVGALYGEFIGRRIETTWREMDCPKKFTIAEQGAMDAQLAVDLMQWACASRSEFFAALHYRIIEPFAKNRERQQARLNETRLAEKVCWASDWNELPERSIVGAVFSNELVDSFPVRQIVRRGDQWNERFVGWKEERFVWIEEPVSPEFASEIVRLEIPPIEGYISEINEHAADWMRSVSSRLAHGIVLTVDYGFERAALYAPERGQGTLQTYRVHQRGDDPLVAVGAQDLTTHIDFTTLIEAGEACGLRTVQFTDQHHFLMERVAEAEREKRVYSPKEIRQLQTLLHPEMLGTRFRYLTLEQGDRPA